MKGMQKISRGSGFSGAVKYTFYGDSRENREYDGELIGGNMTGRTPEELSKEFNLSKKIRPDIKKPVWHNSLRLEKGETLTNEQWVKVADKYMSDLGFTENNQRIYMLHDDDDGQHIHIVASRIGLDGNLYLGKNENLKSTRIISNLEKEFNLNKTAEVKYDKDGKIVMPDKSKLTKKEIDKAVRTKKEPARLQLQKIIDASLAGDKTTLTEFVERLESAGVKVKPNSNKTGIQGFAFELDGIPFAGSKLGDAYKYNSLKKRGLTYDETRESGLLEQLKAEAKADRDNNRDTGKNRNSDKESIDSTAERTEGSETDGQQLIHRTAESDGSENSINSTASEVGTATETTSKSEAGQPKNAESSPDIFRDNQPSGSIQLNSGGDLADIDIISTGNKAIDDLARSFKNSRKKEEEESLQRQRQSLEEYAAMQAKPVSHTQFLQFLERLTPAVAAADYKQEQKKARLKAEYSAVVAREIPNLHKSREITGFKRDWLKPVYSELELNQRTRARLGHADHKLNDEIVAERLQALGMPADLAYQSITAHSAAPDTAQTVASVYASKDLSTDHTSLKEQLEAISAKQKLDREKAEAEKQLDAQKEEERRQEQQQEAQRQKKTRKHEADDELSL